jgi:hypothetical protein
LVLPRGMPECPYVALKPQLCVNIRRQENESKRKEVWIFMTVHSK